MRKRGSGKRQRKYHLVEQVQNGLWYTVGRFYFKSDAERFKKGVPGRTRLVKGSPVPVSPVKTDG